MGRDCLLGDVLTLQRGYDLPSHARREGPIPIVSSSGVTGTHAEAKVAGPGVVTGRYGTLGEIHYVSGAFWPLNTTLYVRDFKGNDPRFVAYFLQTLNFANRSAAAAVPGINRNDLHRIPVHCPDLLQQRRSMSGASGRQRVREACFDTFLLANPDQATLTKFEAVTRPMFQLIHSLALKNSNLRTTRDLLLPKLISGELDVSAVPEPEPLPP